MTKFKKILSTVLAASVALVLTAGFACLSINCSSEESAAKAGKTVYADPVAYPAVYMNEYNTLADAVTANLSDTEAGQIALTLTEDYRFSSGEAGVEIPEGKYITVDLAGHSIDVSGSSTGRAFVLYGTLTLTDSTGHYDDYTGTNKAGVYDNGDGTRTTVYQMTDEDTLETSYCSYTSGAVYGANNTSYGGTVCLGAGATFIMDGGTITGNTHNKGGGILSEGTSSSRNTLVIDGGSVSGNTSTGSGAGIFVEYTDMEVHGGIVSSNAAGSSYYGGGVYVLDASTFYMDEMAGKPTVVSHNTAKNGAGINFGTSGASGEIAGGHIEFNNASGDAAVYTNNGVEFTLSGGIIANNTGSSSGAGMYLRYDNTMSGGTVYNNTLTGSKYGGGGILIYDGYTFTMTGGRIIDNKAESAYGGGICVYDNSKLVVTGGEISGNICKTYGGGIYLKKNNTATMENCMVKDNKTTTQGGGAVHVTSGCTCTMSNVTMEGNSGLYGGAIDVRGTLTISDCVISGNEATGGVAGGMYVYGGTVYMSDTVITDNTATDSVGGVYVSGTLSVSGKVVIENNKFGSGSDYTTGNVLLVKNNYITLGGALSSGSYIGVTLANASQTQITTAEDSTERYKSAGQYFDLDVDNEYFVGYKSGDNFLQLLNGTEAAVVVTWEGTDKTRYFDTLDGALTVAASGDAETQGTATLQRDVEVSSSMTIEEDTFVTLDLNGCSVSWTGGSKTDFFVVEGTMFLYDNSEGACGGEYDGSDEDGVYKVNGTVGTMYKTIYSVMHDDGTLSRYYYQSGAIKDGLSNYGASSNSVTAARGGGICVVSTGALYMYGGTLYNNTATYGGGICTYGYFEMWGGAISENISNNSSSNHNGGGIFSETTSTVYLYGGVVYGNSGIGNGYGGGVENLGTQFYITKYAGDNAYDQDGLGTVITGNYSAVYGGGIYNTGTIYMLDGYVTLNETTANGGGINSYGGPLYLCGGHITGNTAGNFGGGIHSPKTFYMYGGHVNYNTAATYGGGINTESTSYFYGGEVSYNTAGTYGGGINAKGSLYIYSSDDEANSPSLEVNYNTAATYGGGIYSTSNVYIYGGIISYNTASDLGGGVYGTSKIYIYGGKISGNTAKNYGGGVYGTSASTIEMTGGEISENKVTGSQSQGGGMAVYGTGTMSGGKITGNTASYYGGAVYIEKGTFTLSGEAELSENSATRAGAVSVSGKNAKFYMNGGTIANNSATTGNGGGVYAGNSGTYFTMTGGTISGNTAADCAGGLFCNSNSTVKLLGGTIEGNFAANSGAGVYYVSSASVEIGGGLKVIGNYIGTSDGDNTAENLNNIYVLSGTKITVDEDFDGTVYLYAEAAPSLQLSANTVTRDDFVKREMSGHLLSDQGYCVGFNSANSYIYIYESHDYSIIYVGLDDDENNITSTHYCSQCFIKGYECGEEGSDCQANIRYLPDENGHATAYVDETGCTCYGIGASGKVEEGGLYLDYGAILDDGSGNVTWYPDVESAFAAATGDCTVTLLGDITLSEDDVLNLEANQNITLDLNGHTIDGDVEVSGSGSLTITDSRGGGAITGNVSSDLDSTQITISVSGGTYSEDSFESLTLADGFYGLYSKDEDGDVTYTVYSKEEMETVAVAYIAEYDEKSEETGRIYYSLLGDAVICADDGETVTLCRNLDMTEGGDAEESLKIDESVGNVTIDLNGFVLTADITIEAVAVTDSAADPTVSLTVNDSSEYKTGRISGKITVTGTSSDNDLGTGGDTDTTNSFEKTLVIAATAVDSSLEVNTDGLTSTTSTSVEYSFSAITGEDGDVASYGITKGHEHVYSIAEAYEDEQGNIKIKIKCSCGNYYQTGNEDGDVDGSGATVFDLPEGTAIEAVENDDGTVTYYIDEFTVADSTVGTFTADYTVTPLVKIEITNSDGTTETIYLDDNTIGTINTVISGASSVTITLWDNVDLGEDVLTVADCDVTIDLAGYSLSGNITMSSTAENTASLEITDSSSVVTTENDEEKTATSYVTGTGVFAGTISVSEDSVGTTSLTVSGGTYSSEAVTSIEVAFGGMESCLPEYNGTEENSIEYAIIHNLDGSATVTTADNAADEAAVIVKIGDTEMYFSSVQAAVNYIESDSTITGATITLLADCEEDIEIESGFVSIDLNGNTLYGNVKVDENATLTISDSSEGEGHVEGSISGSGKVEGEIIVAEISDGENNYYYTNIETAASALKDGDTLVILRDLGEDGDPVYINVTVEGGVTIDLNGNTVYGDVTSSEGTSLTIKDSATEDTDAGNDGILIGAVSGNSVTITSGTYTQNVGAYVADGKVMLVVTAETGDGNTGETTVKVTYTVVDVSTVPEGAVVSVTDESGNVTYYTDIDTAIASIGFGETITLLGNVTGDLTVTDAGVFTIDLNGNTITGDVTVSGNTALTITDSKEYSDGDEGFGGITGSIEVDAESGATLTIEAGVYSSDVTGYEAEGKVVLVIHDDAGETNSYMVLSENEAREAAVASVTYTDANGVGRTVYFDDVSDAVTCACENSSSESPATVTLYKDVGEEDDIEITTGSVILDMNGYAVSSDISISEGADEGTSLRMTGEGSYGGDTDISGYLDDGLAIYVTENGTLIVDEELAKVNASVSVTMGDTAIYFDDIYAAVEYVNGLENGETVVLTLLEDVALEGDKNTITFTGDVTLDLNGRTFAGNVQAGNDSAAGTLTIEDSSAEEGKGEGLLKGNVTTRTQDDNSVTVTGGTFTDGGVQGMLGEGYVAVVDADGNTVVVSSSDLEKVASASVTTDSGSTYTYYESLDMAIAAVAEGGGTVKILKDAEMTGDTVTIKSSVSIDLNGHTAEVYIIVGADEGGSLKICDADASEVGVVTGNIAVTGSSDGESAAENPYESTLTMDGGVAPNGDLTIDLSGLGTNVEYFFDAVYDDENLTGYGIVKDHVHDFVIEVWNFTEGGGFTLDYMCACGEMWEQSSMVANVGVEIDENGNFVFAATAIGVDGEETTYRYTADIVATVTVDSETYYFETLEAALDFTATVSGSTLTLQKDCDEVANVIGNVTVDLNGHDIGGLTAENGSSVTVTGEGYVSSLDVGEYASVRLQGGTYGTDELVDIETYVDRYNGYAVCVDAEGNVSVVSENYAVINSEASVTDSDGNVTYYETLEDAVEALEGGDTLTLYSDAS
ncbi:MAG: right-handed parallel beta-helix repeat-containing protein, partial [Bacteroidales bacterium]|nr:right-handed parallel beta-helix repeat-containing protein [Bacteroidales bacterium]